MRTLVVLVALVLLASPALALPGGVGPNPDQPAHPEHPQHGQPEHPSHPEHPEHPAAGPEPDPEEPETPEEPAGNETSGNATTSSAAAAPTPVPRAPTPFGCLPYLQGHAGLWYYRVDNALRTMGPVDAAVATYAYTGGFILYAPHYLTYCDTPVW